MAKNESKNIMGQSGNFHRKKYMELYNSGKINKDMGATEQKSIIEDYYKEQGLNPTAVDLTQIYSLGSTKIKNADKEEKGERKKITKEEKNKKESLQKNEDLAAKNRVGKPSRRNDNRKHNRQYEEWKFNKYGTTNRNNADEAMYIKEYLETLREKGYADKTIQMRHEAIHKEQEDVFRKGIELEKKQLKIERHFTSVTKNRRIPLNVSKENMGNYLQLSAATNNIFKNNKTKNKQGDIKKLQQQLVFDTYLAEVKGYKNHNQVTLEDIGDYLKWLQNDKTLDNGKVVPGVSNKTAKGFKTALNQYSVNGNWKIAKELNNTPIKDFGVGKVHTKVVSRALTQQELDKSLDLALNGTNKNKTNANEFIYYTLLTEVGLGVRSDEALNLTVKQLKDILESRQGLHLTKTKGSRERVVPQKVIDYNAKYVKPLNGLLEKAINLNLKENDLIFINAFPENKKYVLEGKTHLIKHRVKDWVRNHRSKFQDDDRIRNREITKINDKIENREDITVLRGEITSHAYRHTFASNMFTAFKNTNDVEFANNPEFREKMYKVYVEERTKYGKSFNPDPLKMDYYTERGYHIYNCQQVSLLVGHFRYDVTEQYIVTTDSKGKLIGIELDTYKEFELEPNGDGTYNTAKERE